MKVLRMLFPEKSSEVLKSTLLQCGTDVLAAIEHIRSSSTTDSPMPPAADQIIQPTRSRSPVEQEKRKEPNRRKKKSNESTSKNRIVTESPPRPKKQRSPPRRTCWSPNDRFASPATQVLSTSPDSSNGTSILNTVTSVQPSQISRMPISSYGVSAMSPAIIPAHFSAARLFRSAFAAPAHSAGAFCPAGLAAGFFAGFQHGPHPHQPYSAILPGHSSLLYPPTPSMLQSYAPPPPGHHNPSGTGSCNGNFLRFSPPHFAPTFGAIQPPTTTANDRGIFGNLEESHLDKSEPN